MDETYFNVVYFFKYLVDLQGDSDTIKFCLEVCFKVYFKHYRTKYFIFHILYVAHSRYHTYIVFKLLFEKKQNICYK